MLLNQDHAALMCKMCTCKLLNLVSGPSILLSPTVNVEVVDSYEIQHGTTHSLPHVLQSWALANEQVEEFDSEIESLQSNVKRKQKPPPRLAHLEESVNRHKTHIGRLEQIIRLLDNDALHPDELSQVVNEEIQEYIDRNQEDFDAYEVSHVLLSNWLPCCMLLLIPAAS